MVNFVYSVPQLFRLVPCPSMAKVPPLAVPQLGSCASSGRAWRLWAARRSREEAGPLDAQPLPRVLELTASKAAHFAAFDHSGTGDSRGAACGAGRGAASRGGHQGGAHRRARAVP